MNEAPQTSIMLFSCSCWVGKLFMSFNLRMTSVLWSERDGEKSFGCLLQLDAILYSKCWSNVTTQCKRFFYFRYFNYSNKQIFWLFWLGAQEPRPRVLWTSVCQRQRKEEECVFFAISSCLLFFISTVTILCLTN